MEILNEYIVFISYFLGGILFFIMSVFCFMKANLKQYDNYLCQHMFYLSYRIMFIISIAGAIFKLSGTMFPEKILQAGVLGMISIVAIKFFTYSYFLEDEPISQEEITEYKLRDYYKKINLFSPLFIIWFVFSLLLSICVYISCFYLFGKIVPTVATTFVVFIIDLFLGIELINRINKFLEKMTLVNKKGE
jgi:hypothetical protein